MHSSPLWGCDGEVVSGLDFRSQGWWGYPCDGVASHPGEVAILSVVSCNRNRIKIRPFGLLWIVCDFILTYIDPYRDPLAQVVFESYSQTLCCIGGGSNFLICG